MIKNYIGFCVFLFVMVGCLPAEEANEPAVTSVATEVITSPEKTALKKNTAADEFGEYWYQGEAEITSYHLEQARYGEIHEGESVFIFVTEDFSKEKQVKLDVPERNPSDKVSVLKLNMTRQFVTGLYPYSMMSSVFTPISRDQFPHTLKVTTSSQEWCGHTFSQLNYKKGGYELDFKSYFESEGDQQKKLRGGVLEDEIWSLIRLNPDALPTGTFKVIPGTIFQRLSHSEWGEKTALGKLEPADADGLLVYSLRYPEENRTLKITFNKQFPHEIEGWEDTYKSGWGANAPILTTKAVLKKRIKLDYWNRNRNADAPLRESLDLE